MGDAHFKQKAERALKERIMGNQTVVFVSHSDAQVRKLCDRAIWLSDAVIAAEGETEDVVEAYQQYIKMLNEQSG